ncbi:uncharacterized protein LOC126195722 [Schistocerca nitens]|uniref:uncharacterized protein LOC126195722 n=1 Tax=Schistocerca nitens TaxID=7011 RepID=UPI0021197AAC|nr:uncharacterized protein LOC126195722 [Schistocerca nitens]
MEAEAKALLGPSGTALQLLGMWRPPGSGPAGPWMLAALFVVATDALVSASSFVQLVVDTPTDPETLRDVFFQCTCSGAWAVRAVLFMQQRDRLGRLVVTLLDTRKRYVEQVPGIRRIYDRRAATVFNVWQLLPLTALSLWALEPVTDAPKLVTVGNSTMVVRREPLVLWLPLDTQQSPVYEIVFALQVVGIVSVSEASILLDIFLACLVIHVTAEIAVLNKNVSSIHMARLDEKRSHLQESGDVTAVGREKDKGVVLFPGSEECVKWSPVVPAHLPNNTLLYDQDANRRLYASLKTNIQHHQTIILCVNELEQVMSMSTYIILLVNALTICLHAFGFVELFQGGGKGGAVVKRLMACPVYMGQTAVFCLVGQSLTDHPFSGSFSFLDEYNSGENHLGSLR